MDSEISELASEIRQIERLLQAYGSSFWAREMDICAQAIERSDGYGLDRFLGAFGGMGSLNDLVLQREGQMLGRENDRLNELRSSAYQLARKLRDAG